MKKTVLDFSTSWQPLWSELPPLSDGAIGAVSGVFRSSPEDFRVDEILGCDFSGEGEHVYLQIEKIGQNTLWVIEELGRQLGVDRALFGRSGIKDRHAVTTQWISIQDPKSALTFDALDIPGVRILAIERHDKKLRPGAHLENRFQLQLRGLNGTDAIESVLTSISERGFPNYFGEQRFGFDNQNLQRGWELLASRRLAKHKKKGIYLSALRSFLFNKVLDTRVKEDLFQIPDEFDDTGPMWGRGRIQASKKQQAYEQEVLEAWRPLCDALEYSGLNQERRPLLVIPKEVDWKWIAPDHLELIFSLPAGAYATSLIRELGNIIDGSRADQFKQVQRVD